MKFEFDPQADAVYLELTEAEVEDSREIQPGIIMDYDAEGQSEPEQDRVVAALKAQKKAKG